MQNIRHNTQNGGPQPHKLQAEYYIITEWSGTQNKIKYNHPIKIFNLKARQNFKLTIDSRYTS